MLKIHAGLGHAQPITAAKPPPFAGSTSTPVAHAGLDHVPTRAHVGSVQHIRFSGISQLPGATGASLYFSGATRKFMSYNAEGFFRSRETRDQNGKVIPPQDMKDPKSIKALAEVILKEDPDVVALQEVGDQRLLQDFNYKYLKNKYPKIVSFAVAPGGLRVAMMAKRNIQIVEAKSHLKEQLGDGPPSGKRDLLEATFETETGYRFTVFDAHFKAMTASRDDLPPGQTAEQYTMPVRLQEATTAAKIIQRRFDQDPNARVIVSGDINTLHDSKFGKPVLDILTLSKDKDPNNDLTEVMLKDGKAVPTHKGKKPYYPDSKLDYTFVSKALLPEVRDAYVAGKFDQAPWMNASDHLPLVTVLEEPDNIVKPQAVRRETFQHKQLRKHGRNGRRFDRTA